MNVCAAVAGDDASGEAAQKLSLAPAGWRLVDIIAPVPPQQDPTHVCAIK